MALPSSDEALSLRPSERGTSEHCTQATEMAQGLLGYPPPPWAKQWLNTTFELTDWGCVVAAASDCTGHTGPAHIGTHRDHSVLGSVFYMWLKGGTNLRRDKEASQVLPQPPRCQAALQLSLDGLLSPRALHKPEPQPGVEMMCSSPTLSSSRQHGAMRLFAA